MSGLLGDPPSGFLFGNGLDFGINLLGSFIGFGGTPVPDPPPPIVAGAPPPDTTTAITSLSSSTAFHPTLFEDFGLRAIATYNFYVTDETTTFVSDPSASLASLPRYVTLRWNQAPAPRQFSFSRKGFRPLDSRSLRIPPALPAETATVSVANGYVAPGVIQALLVDPVQPPPPPTFSEELFLSSDSAAGRHATQDALVDPAFQLISPIPPANRTRVNFIDPSIAGAIDQNRVSVAADHVFLASLGSFAKLAPGLEVVSEFNQDVPLRNPVPKFPISSAAPTLSYIGYSIERYTLDPSGSMTLSKRLAINDVTQTTAVDREVVFGGRYAYRVRSILQWVHGPTVGFFGTSSLDRSPDFDTSSDPLAAQASYYNSEWSDWARTSILDVIPPDPPDELRVMPISAKNMVRITWKMPGDPQRDISALRLLRAEGSAGRFSDWKQIGEFVPGNGSFNDLLVSPYERSHTEYMYAMYSVSFHGEISGLSERIIARLTDRSLYLGEEPVRRAGPPGDDPTMHARGPQVPPETEVIAQDRFIAYIRGGKSSLPLFDRPYVVEVQSVSTGERAEVLLDVDTTDVGIAVAGGTARPA